MCCVVTHIYKGFSFPETAGVNALTCLGTCLGKMGVPKMATSSTGSANSANSANRDNSADRAYSVSPGGGAATAV